MAQTPSTMIPLGTVAPDFQLPDVVSGKTLSLADVTGAKATVIMFICNHCPFVKHINPAIPDLVAHYKKQGVGFVGISSNDVVNYPDDSPEKMKDVATTVPYDFPYLYDESQQTAKAYHAACTPDFFVYDGANKLVYRGQMDDSRPGNGKPVTAADLKAALDAIVAGTPVSDDQKPSIGCNIKWKS